MAMTGFVRCIYVWLLVSCSHVLNTVNSNLQRQYSRNTKHSMRFSLFMSGRGSFSYKSVEVATEDTQSRVSLLVKSENEQEVMRTVQRWNAKVDKNAFESQIATWISAGVAFPNSPEGTRLIYKSESKIGIDERQRPFSAGSRRLSKRSTIAADVYVNCGSEESPVYIKAAQHIPDQQQIHIDSLRKKGVAFTNTTELFTAEQVLNRADSIAIKLKNEFEITSPEWQRWTNKTSVYNATSLTQVFAEYFAQHSIGDVGGAGYVPKAGFPGTLAPGINFKEDCPFESLPKRILHPWPAMQQIQWHVRWPPSHPMIPPPLLWAALNNMYTENFTKWQLNEEFASEPIVGGYLMQAKDAVRIAARSTFGNSYELSEQIPHGGMIFDSGRKIPFYNPDHGPTVSDAEAAPNIPERLIPITTTWLDSMYGMEVPFADPMTPNESLEESEERITEAQQRMVLAEKMLAARNSKRQQQVPQESSTMRKFPLWQTKQEEDVEALNNEVETLISAERSALEKEKDKGAPSPIPEIGTVVKEEDPSQGYILVSTEGEISEGTLDLSAVRSIDNDQYWQSRRAAIRKEIQATKQLAAISSGQARPTRQVITYTIASMRSMTEFIMNAERDVSMAKKSSRKGRKKTRVSDGAGGDDDDDFPMATIEEEPGFYDSGDSFESFSD